MDNFSIERVADRQEIEYRVMSFCRGVDRRDKDLARSAFHDNGTDDHGGFAGPVDGLLDWIWERHEKLPVCFHHVGSVSIDFVDENNAMCESYCITIISSEGENVDPDAEEKPQILTFNRYVDHFVRRDGAWRIETRKTILEAKMPVPGSANPLPVNGIKPTRDENDYSWQLRRKLGLRK